MTEIKLRLRKDAKLLYEAFGVDERRTEEMDAFLRRVISRCRTISEMLEEIWNTDALDFPEKVLMTFVLGYNFGFMKGCGGTGMVIFFLARGGMNGEVAG